jgi:hypothetical protein
VEPLDAHVGVRASGLLGGLEGRGIDGFRRRRIERVDS